MTPSISASADPTTDPQSEPPATGPGPSAAPTSVAPLPPAPAEVNTGTMRKAAEAIDAGEVTQAVRASQTEAGSVAEGDWLGIVRGDGIVAVAPDPLGAITALLARLVDEHQVDQVSYASVRDYVARRRPHIQAEAGRATEQAFVPQTHAPGE